MSHDLPKQLNTKLYLAGGIGSRSLAECGRVERGVTQANIASASPKLSLELWAFLMSSMSIDNT
jgi:hypothetical protein